MDPSWDAYIAFKILYEELKGEIRANILAKEKEAIVKEYEDEWAKKMAKHYDGRGSLRYSDIYPE